MQGPRCGQRGQGSTSKLAGQLYAACCSSHRACSVSGVTPTSPCSGVALATDDLTGNIDLSEAAFTRLTAKINALLTLKVRLQTLDALFTTC